MDLLQAQKKQNNFDRQCNRKTFFHQLSAGCRGVVCAAGGGRTAAAATTTTAAAAAAEDFLLPVLVHAALGGGTGEGDDLGVPASVGRSAQATQVGRQTIPSSKLFLHTYA